MTRDQVEALYAPIRDVHRYGARDPGVLGMSAATQSKVVAGAELLAGAAIAGLLAGRSGSPDLASTGLPLGLTIGGLGLLGVWSGKLPEGWDDHVFYLSIGLAAASATLWGLGQGQKKDAIKGAPDAVRGAPARMTGAPAYAALPPAYAAIGARPLNEAELHAIMMRR